MARLYVRLFFTVCSALVCTHSRSGPVTAVAIFWHYPVTRLEQLESRAEAGVRLVRPALLANDQQRLVLRDSGGNNKSQRLLRKEKEAYFWRPLAEIHISALFIFDVIFALGAGGGPYGPAAAALAHA